MSKQRLSAVGSGRRNLVLAAGAGALGLVLPRYAIAQQKFTCRIAHSEAIGSPLTVALEKYTLVLREKSGGRIDAQHFPAGQLGNYTQLIEQSRIGTIQITAGGPDTEESGRARDRRRRRRARLHVQGRGARRPRAAGRDRAGDLGDRAQEDRRRVRRLRRGRVPPPAVEDGR